MSESEATSTTSDDELMISLTGTWYNELGSEMELAAAGGYLAGKYNSHKGKASGWYEFFGRYDPDAPSDKGTTISWTVQWKNDGQSNSHSITSWSGQFFKIDGKTPYIRTMWMLSYSTTHGEEWGSVLIGADKFTQKKPGSEEIEIKLSMLAALGHPV